MAFSLRTDDDNKMKTQNDDCEEFKIYLSTVFSIIIIILKFFLKVKPSIDRHLELLQLFKIECNWNTIDRR